MKVNSLLLISLFWLLIGAVCGKEEKEGACKSGREHINVSRFIDNQDKFVAWTGNFTAGSNEIYYQRNIGSKVSFFIAFNQTNICAKSHIRVNYYCVRTSEATSTPIKIFGEGYWSNFDEKIILNDGVSEADANYSKVFEFGLKQAFQDNAGNLDLFLTVEFERHATLEEDIAFFVKNFKQISMSYDYDLHH